MAQRLPVGDVLEGESMNACDYLRKMHASGMPEKDISMALGRALIAYVNNQQKQGHDIARDVRNICADAAHRATRFRMVREEKLERERRRSSLDCPMQVIGDGEDDEDGGESVPLPCIKAEHVK